MAIVYFGGDATLYRGEAAGKQGPVRCLDLGQTVMVQFHVNTREPDTEKQTFMEVTQMGGAVLLLRNFAVIRTLQALLREDRFGAVTTGNGTNTFLMVDKGRLHIVPPKPDVVTDYDFVAMIVPSPDAGRALFFPVKERDAAGDPVAEELQKLAPGIKVISADYSFRPSGTMMETVISLGTAFEGPLHQKLREECKKLSPQTGPQRRP